MKKRILTVFISINLLLSSLFACTTGNEPVDTLEETQAVTVPMVTDIDTDTESQTELQETQEQTLPEETTQEDIMPIQPVEVNQRYFIYRIWNFTERKLSTFKYIVDAAAADGFNAIKVHIPWHRVETTAGVYDYTIFDEMIDYVVNEKGLKVAISLDMTRRLGDTVLTEEDIMKNRAGDLCMGGSETGDRLQISFNSQNAMTKCEAFYGDAVSHYHQKYGDAVLFYLPAFSQYCETEYWCVSEYDYSTNAINAFHSFLQGLYGDIATFNKALETDYATFEDVTPPSATSGDALGQLWYTFRHKSLKAAIDMLAAKQDEVAPNTKFAIQVGCAYDDAAKLRGTLGIADLCENVDVFWADDGPLMNHHFSMDYARSNLPAHIELGQEIDGPAQYGASPESYLAQGLTSFERGCTYVSIANWGINSDYERYRSVWQQIVSTWLGNTPPDVVQPSQNPEVIKVSLKKMLQGNAIDRYLNLYKRASKNGEFVYFEVTDDLTTDLP